jgi:Tfp pilus assembly protein FimT
MFGVMTSVAVSSLRQIVTKDVESGSARTVASLLKRARIHAVSAHARVQVGLTATPNAMALSSCRAVYGGRPACVTGEVLTPMPGAAYTFGRGDFRGVRVTGPATPVVFSTDGSLEGLEAVTFTVDHPDYPGSRIVDVSAAGDVRVR